jgi:hypothetical protein
MSWNLAADFSHAPAMVNPNPDSYGNGHVWSFLESASFAHDPSTYHLLLNSTANAFLINGLEGWRGTMAFSGNNVLSLVGINASGVFQQAISISWPAGVVSMHPTPTQLVIVGWQSPIHGTVSITGGVTDLDGHCGNGIIWTIDRGSTTLASGSYPDGGQQSFAAGVGGADLSELTVQTGEMLYFIVDPNGEYGCDSTGMDVTITPINITTPPPTVTITGAPASSTEGTPISLASTVSDSNTSDTFSYAWKVLKNGVPYTSGAESTLLLTPDDNATYDVTLLVTDSAGGTGTTHVSIPVANLPPQITSIVGPITPLALIQGQATTTVVASFTDAGTLDNHICTYTWDDGQVSTTSAAGTGNGACSAAHTFTTTGVYSVQVSVADIDGGSVTSAIVFVVIYDPTGGGVTGSGSIISPPGSYAPKPTVSGKGSFGFTSKYKRGAVVPSGEMEFELESTDFHFKSTTYQWLILNGAKAQFRGVGKVNDHSGYGFLITATDGKIAGGVDTFRLKIWELSSGVVIYDNARGSSDDIDIANPQALKHGNIVIQSGAN